MRFERSSCPIRALRARIATAARAGRLGWFAWMLAPLLAAPTCGFDGERDEGAACTRRDDCRDDLQCSGGVCVAPDGGGARPDAGADASPDMR